MCSKTSRNIKKIQHNYEVTFKEGFKMKKKRKMKGQIRKTSE